ncbi:MAG: hypothetical protein ACKPA7_25620, partial [Sphaerospermopsis kisseleviana]
MAFQDFIASKVSEKAALEAALKRVQTELGAANDAAPVIDKVVNQIIDLVSILKTSPKAVVDAAKDAIREACGDFLLPNPETITLVIPEFVTAIPPVSEDIVNIVSIVGEANTADTTSANDIVAYNTTENTRTTENTETTEITETTEKTPKSKRRTQAGFNRKVEEWHKILDNLNSENYEVLIAQVGDDLGFWTDGTKFVSQEVTEKLQEAIAFWSANFPETLETPSTESNTESNDVNDGIETQDEINTGETPINDIIESFLNR